MQNASNLTVEEQAPAFTARVISQQVIGCVVLVANLLMLLTIAMNRALRTSISPIVVSLSMTDFLVGVTTLTTQWLQSDLMVFLTNMSIVSSMFHLILIAGDRFVAICAPLRYHNLYSAKSVIIALSVTWMVAAIISAFMEFTSTLGENIQFKIETLIFFITVGSLMVLYGYIGRVAFQQRRKIHNQTGQQGQKIPKATRVLTAVLGAYLCLWGPYMVCTWALMQHNNGWCTHDIMMYVILMGFSNSWINIFIYLLMSSQFRRAFINVLCCRRGEMQN